MKTIFFSIFLIFFAACSSNMPEHYRERGSAIIRSLVKELKKIRTKEELMDRYTKIEDSFKRLHLLVEESRELLARNPEMEIPLFSRQDQDLSDELQSEINRLLRVEGCREVLNQFLTNSG